MKALDSIWEISVYSFVVRRSRVLCPGEQVAAAGRDALHLRLCVLTGAEGAVEGLPRIGDYGHAVVLRRACTPRARRSHQASALERRDVGSSAPGLYSMQVPSGPGRRGMPGNIEDFTHPSLLWGIDGNFDLQYVPSGQAFATTDHCGTVQILEPSIIPEYLLYAISLG